MDQEKRQSIALMRYSVIAPLITGLSDEYGSLEAFYRNASAKGVTHPDGTLKHYSPGTMEKWYRNYKQHGFDALVPAGRADLGKPRKLDDELQEQIRYLKSNYPRMSAAAICRQLQDNGSIKNGEVSPSTVNRYINMISLQMKTATSPDMRRYERPHINEIWCGYSSVGPYLKTDDGRKHKVYIIALIDDASRFIVGIDIFFNDNFINLMSVMKSAVARYGRPQMFNFDNGSSYKNKQMELLAARFVPPEAPLLSSLDIRDFHSLDELRGSLFSYVQSYNQSVHSSLHGKSPQDRFFSEPDRIRRLPDEEIGHCFLLEIERRVSSDSVIVIGQTEYEVDCRFAKQRIKLRYSPDMKDIFIVEADGTLTPIRLLNKTENAFVKREKIHLCRGEE